MTVKTSRGKTFEINWAWCRNLRGDQMMIELKDDRPMAEIALDFDGVETFEIQNEKNPNVKEVYTGYTRMVIMSRDNADGVIRLTLAKE